MQETATLAAAGKAADWTLNVNLGAIGIAANDAAAYFRNLEVRSARPLALRRLLYAHHLCTTSGQLCVSNWPPLGYCDRKLERLKSPLRCSVPRQASLVTGTTLIIDLPYPGYPDNMGHWAETLLPVYSVLSGDEWRRDVVRAGGAPHLDTILFSNLRRQQLQVAPWLRVSCHCVCNIDHVALPFTFTMCRRNWLARPVAFPCAPAVSRWSDGT